MLPLEIRVNINLVFYHRANSNGLITRSSLIVELKAYYTACGSSPNIFDYVTRCTEDKSPPYGSRLLKDHPFVDGN